MLNCTNKTAYAISSITSVTPIRIAVFLNSFNDIFISDVKNNLEDIQKENENKVQFTFFNENGNQAIQNENIDTAINDNFDLFVLNPVSTDINQLQGSLNKIAQKGIPLILYYAKTKPIINFIRNYPNSVIIDTDVNQSGILQGKILVDTWKANKDNLDQNKDNIIQYVILKGPSNSPETIARSKYSILTLNDAGIETEELLSIPCNWEEECARTSIESSLLKLDGKIEAIISNNYAMAIGAIETLKKYGYNKSSTSKKS